MRSDGSYMQLRQAPSNSPDESRCIHSAILSVQVYSKTDTSLRSKKLFHLDYIN